MEKNKHKFYMAQILSLIFKDKDLSLQCAGIQGRDLIDVLPQPQSLLDRP